MDEAGYDCESNSYEVSQSISDVVAIVSLSLVWFIMRAFRLTASVVADAIGLGKMTAPFSLWEKMSCYPLQRNEDSAPCIHGREKEPLVVDMTQKRTGLIIDESSLCFDKKFGWLAATPDGYVKHDLLVLREDRGCNLKEPVNIAEFKEDEIAKAPDAIIECKAPYNRAYKGVPIHYVIQTFVQMRVTGVKTTYLTCYWADGRCMKIWRISWCDKVWDYIERRMLLFISCLYNKYRPSLTLLPYLYYETTELVDSGFCPKKRIEIAQRNNISPFDLIPDIKIETIVDEEDPYFYDGNQKVEKDKLV